VQADNLPALAGKVKEVLAADTGEQRMKFEVRGREGRGFWINKKGDPLYRKLATYDTAK
jgi:hypothetical protein